MVDNISNTSINSTASTGHHHHVKQNFKMTDDQKKELTDLLSKYDPQNMSQDNMKSLMDGVKSLGIKPGDDFKSIMEANGFKVPEKPHRQEGQQQAVSAVNSAIPGFVLDFAKNLEGGNVTQNQIDAFIQNVKDSGSSTTGLLVDQKA